MHETLASNVAPDSANEEKLFYTNNIVLNCSLLLQRVERLVSKGRLLEVGDFRRTSLAWSNFRKVGRLN